MDVISRFLLLLALLLQVFAEQPPKVSLDNLGSLVGKEIKTRGNRTIHGFQGIPFAESPSGTRRFQAPVTRTWSGELDATSPGIPCVQYVPEQIKSRSRRGLIWDLPITNNFSLSDPEDCLSLNVYTPDLSHSERLPVVVFFHGGSFMMGSEAKFRPEFLLDRDVVLVVPQYRLGPFGFLSMQNDLIPGNAGLLDTVEALKWVEKHIGKFGGDKSKVTVFGQSAGAAIANFLVLSPLAKGLIHGVISNSGSALAAWAIDTEPVKDAKRIATLAKCLGDNEKISRCLQELPAEKLLAAFTAYSNLGGSGGTLPVISRPEEPKGTNFLPEHPATIAEKGKYQAVPMMAGATRHDSMFMINIMYGILNATNLLEDELFVRKKLTKRIVEFSGIRDPTMLITDMLEKRYLSSVPIQMRGNFTYLVPGLLDFVTTATMKAPGYRMVQINSEKAASYWYTFNYQGRYHLPENGVNDPGGLFTRGATHSDDMIYLTPRIDEPFNDIELGISELMVNLWANFITSGNPNVQDKIAPDWRPYNQTEENYFEINAQSRAKNDFTLEYVAAVYDFPDFATGCSVMKRVNLFIVWMIVGLMKVMQ